MDDEVSHRPRTPAPDREANMWLFTQVPPLTPERHAVSYPAVSPHGERVQPNSTGEGRIFYHFIVCLKGFPSSPDFFFRFPGFLRIFACVFVFDPKIFWLYAPEINQYFTDVFTKI